MKKYSFWIVVLLGFTFACNSPASDNEKDSSTSAAQETTLSDTLSAEKSAIITAVAKEAVKEEIEEFISELSTVVELTEEEKSKIKASANTDAQGVISASREKEKISSERRMWDNALETLDEEEAIKLKGFLEEKWSKEDAEIQRKNEEKYAEERRIKLKKMREKGKQ